MIPLMDFTYSEEQVMLREGARRFLSEKCPVERVREIVETDDGFDADLWSAIAEQGWTAMHIPEQYGGAGFSLRRDRHPPPRDGPGAGTGSVPVVGGPGNRGRAGGWKR